MEKNGKIPNNLKVDKVAFASIISSNPTRYAFSNPYSRTARNTQNGAVITAKVTGFIEGNAIKQGDNEVIPVYVVTDKNTRCRISIEQFNQIEIGSTITVVKREAMMPGRTDATHFFELDSVVDTTNVSVDTTKATATA